MYLLILKEIEYSERDNRMGRRMFELVLFACRSLRVYELQHALAIVDELDISWIVPSQQTFEDNLIVGMEKRILHCGRNLLKRKDHNDNF